VLSNFENIDGSNHADRLFGDNGANLLRGMSGNDILLGFDGNDTLHGGSGNDILNGGDGNDVHYGADGNDIIQGSFGNDLILGGNGNDIIGGMSGSDAMDGGAGYDTARYIWSIFGVTVNLLAGTASGHQAHGDRLINIENVEGSNHADTLIGDHGSNILTGLAGNDTLTGNNGRDIFVFADDFGQDTITDMGVNVDDIMINLTAITDYNDLVNNHLNQSGSNSIITDGVNTITIQNVLNNQLDADDFIFV